jgi:hypothetical protein
MAPHSRTCEIFPSIITSTAVLYITTNRCRRHFPTVKISEAEADLHVLSQFETEMTKNMGHNDMKTEDYILSSHFCRSDFPFVSVTPCPILYFLLPSYGATAQIGPWPALLRFLNHTQLDTR